MVWVVLALVLLGPAPSRAQTAAKGTVTVFTDGFAYPNGRLSRALTELSVAFDQAGKLRILPIMGYGGEGNIRDLLRLRGADLAIVNADVLAIPGLDKAYPEARRKLRSITRLYTQKAFLLARPEIGALGQLAGKKVAVFGPESVTRLTAGVVFGRLGVKAELVKAASGADPLGEAQAIFLLQDDAERLPSDILAATGLRPIPIPRNAALTAIYRTAVIAPGETRFAVADPVETISIDTVLATFDWTRTHGRYEDVTAFIDALFEMLPKLRADYPASIWRQTDPHAEVPGWRVYGYAQDVRKSVPPAPPAEAAPPRPVPQPQAAAPATAAAPLRLSLVAQPPLTDPRAPGGGLIAELTAAALQRAPGGLAPPVLQWEKDKASQLRSVLSEKGADLGIPWEQPDCDNPKHLGMEAAAVCDGGLVSEPLCKVLELDEAEVRKSLEQTDGAQLDSLMQQLEEGAADDTGTEADHAV